MATRKIVDNDGFVPTIYHTDDYGNIELIERQDDIGELLKQNEIMRNDWDGYSPSRNMRHVAEIPTVVYEHIQKLGITDDPKKFKAWLNDPDNKMFRVTDGRV